jgi:hypothetical protein
MPTRQEILTSIVERILARAETDGDATPFFDESVINGAVSALARAVVEDDIVIRPVGQGTLWELGGEQVRTWDVVRFLADVMEHG